jgi:hypothetical protein
MSLWGKLDAANNAPKFLLDGANTTIVPSANTDRDYGGLPMQVDINNSYLVDVTEAGYSENRANGIKTPGWILYKEYGTGRKFVETLVPMRVTADISGDREDVVVADGIITITTQPASQSVGRSVPVTFSVVAASDPFATLAYQWSKAESTNTASWSNITGETSTVLTITSANSTNGSNTFFGSNGDYYRVTVSGTGFASVISSNAVLTVS